MTENKNYVTVPQAAEDGQFFELVKPMKGKKVRLELVDASLRFGRIQVVLQELTESNGSYHQSGKSTIWVDKNVLGVFATKILNCRLEPNEKGYWFTAGPMGTPARNGNPCQYRTMFIRQGDKQPFLMTSAIGEGVQDGRGLILPKDRNKMKTITIAMSRPEMEQMCFAILSVINGYKTAQYLAQYMEAANHTPTPVQHQVNQYGEVVEQPARQAAAPRRQAPEPQPAVVENQPWDEVTVDDLYY